MGKVIAVIGGGPAGLIAAEQLARAGMAVTVFDRMPSVGRKFLMAGRGGLNLTHSEPVSAFLPRYGAAAPHIEAALAAFSPGDVRQWAAELGEETFVGSSGRIFPKSFKASPLLRAWLRRLAGLGVTIRTRHAWRGWSPAGALVFDTPEGIQEIRSDATLLALGGASWPRLGSDGGWVPLLAQHGIAVAPLLPSNSGVLTTWSNVFRSRFAGQPVKRVGLSVGQAHTTGEMVVTGGGLEGGAVYALSTAIRDALRGEKPMLHLDLKPDLQHDALVRKLGHSRRGDTISNTLRKALGLQPVQIGLLREAAGRELPTDPAKLAELVKSVPIPLAGIQGIDRAISSAGGIPFEALDSHFMLRALPGTFAAGEMLDWEAPTGGYLLQGSFSTGAVAAKGIAEWLADRES